MEELHKDLYKKIRGSNVLALPQSATKVLELSKDSDNGPAEYEMPIVADPGLSAQILSFANSSFFGFSHKITTVRMALTLVSIRTIRNFVLWNAVFSLLPNPKIGDFVLKRFYQDALRRAVFCKVFGGVFKGLDAEQLFVSGLFQDIAIPVLIQHWPKDYSDILEQQKQGMTRISELEKKHFGWDHAVAGALLVEEWGLDEEVARNVANHIKPEIEGVDSSKGLADAVVQISGLLPSAGEETFWRDADRFFPMLQTIISATKGTIKSTIPKPMELFERVDAQYEDMLNIARLPAPKQTLRDCMKEYFRSLDEEHAI